MYERGFSTGATLHGSLNPRGSATSYQFEFGTTTAYGSATPLTTGGAANRPADVSAVVTGLVAGTTHHFRLVAVRGTQRFPGPDATFTTTGSPPATAVVAPKRPSLKQRARRARVTCTRRRGTFRCRVTRAGSTLRARLTMRKGNASSAEAAARPASGSPSEAQKRSRAATRSPSRCSNAAAAPPPRSGSRFAERHPRV